MRAGSHAPNLEEDIRNFEELDRLRSENLRKRQFNKHHRHKQAPGTTKLSV